MTILEGFLARGDRKAAQVIRKAYESGALYDAWSETFRMDLWMKAFEDTQISLDFYTLRPRDTQELLPWDFIDAGVTKEFLAREWRHAQQEKGTPNCRMQCSGCGANRYQGGVCYEGQN